jgi:hypothetical protein
MISWRDIRDFFLALPPATENGSRSSVRALKLEIEQWQIQLAGCLTAAEGYAGANPPKQGDWAWSPAFQAVLNLRRDYDYVKKLAVDLQDAAAERAATPGPRETHQRSRICNMRWSNTTVLLGDTDFVRCRFFNCKLIDDGPFSMEKCFMENCTIQTAKERQHEKADPRASSIR